MICICPDCGRRGSLQSIDKKGHTYWYVNHGESGNKDRCWLGRNYHEVTVLDDEGVREIEIGEEGYEKYQREEKKAKEEAEA